MKLKDTIDLMCSDDYKDRFCAEYHQTLNRAQSLSRMLEKWDKGMLEFTPTCTRTIYNEQLYLMNEYLNVLENRATIENIKL